MILQKATKYYWKVFFYGLSLIGTNYLNAQENAVSKKFYVGTEIGVGFLHFSNDNSDGNRTARFALGFQAGYIPFRALRFGVNLNGYLIEPSNYSNPEKGISIFNTQAQIQIMPLKEYNLFANIQGGWSKYTNNHPNASGYKGTAAKIGLGYEYSLGSRLFLAVIFNYSMGTFNDSNYPGVSTTDQHYNAYEIVTCITFR